MSILRDTTNPQLERLIELALDQDHSALLLMAAAEGNRRAREANR